MDERDLIYDWNRAGGGAAAFDWSRVRVDLNDETLRDGLQSPSAHDPSLEVKKRLLHLMADLGIVAADIGLPGAGPRVVEQVRALATEIRDARLPIAPNCAARTVIADIEPIVRVADEVGIKIEAATFIGSSPIRQYAEDWTLDRIVQSTVEAVTYAVKHGLPVMYVTEDTTRAKPEALKALYGAAIECGATRICLADTVGHATPYGVTKNVTVARGGGFDHPQRVAGGADIKYGVTSNLTLDATVNPDFGQVEADPAVLNLTAFETFFQERRPFFVAGTGIFRFDVNCSQVNCNGERLFYSRRIGRAPQLGRGDPESPIATTISSAAKLTGRLPGGQTVGVLDAVTQRAAGNADRTTEPATNYAAIRAQQDFRSGGSGVGVMATAVNRSLDPLTDASLRRSAYVGALDFRHRFLGSRYQLSGSVDVSRVRGTPSAIAATQRDPVHYYQRPDAGLPFDSTRTSLAGDAEELLFGKVGGGITRFETSYQRRSPGFEVNDLGFLLRADQQSWNNWLGLHFNDHPNRVFQQAYWNFNWWQYWTARGLPQERALSTNAHVQLNSRWWVSVGGTGQLGGVFDDRSAR